MAFKTTEKKETKEKIYRKVGTIWESQKFEGHYIGTDDYYGALLFQDKETNKIFKVKGFSLFEPREGDPVGKTYDLVINILNPKQVEEIVDLDNQN